MNENEYLLNPTPGSKTRVYLLTLEDGPPNHMHVEAEFPEAARAYAEAEGYEVEKVRLWNDWKATPASL